MVNLTINQGELRQSEVTPTAPSAGENKQSKSELSTFQINKIEFINSLSMESQNPVNSISEITRGQRAGWLRQGNKVIKFASVKPLETRLSSDETPSSSLESEEVRNFEYSGRIDDGRQYNYNNNMNYYHQNGPIYQEPIFDNRVAMQFMPSPQLPPPPPPQQSMVNGYTRPPFATIASVPIIHQTSIPYPHFFHGHIHHPPIQHIPYFLPQVNNIPLPTFVGCSCHPTTIIDYAVTRRVLYPPLNPVVHIGGNYNHDYQQPHNISQSIPQQSNIDLSSHQNVDPIDMVSNGNGSGMVNSENTHNHDDNNFMIDENTNILQQQLPTATMIPNDDMPIEVDGREGNITVSNISSSINESQENVPNRDI